MHRQFRYLATLAEERHFGKAPWRLSTSQPKRGLWKLVRVAPHRPPKKLDGKSWCDRNRTPAAVPSAADSYGQQRDFTGILSEFGAPVPELCQNPIYFDLGNLLFEREQIPQVVDIRHFSME